MRSLLLGCIVGAAATAVATSAPTIGAQQETPTGATSAAPAPSTTSTAAPIARASDPGLRIMPLSPSGAPMMRAAHNAVSHADHADTLESSVVSGLRIASITDGASVVTLDDGTVWQVYLPDRPDVDMWRVGDFVSVKLLPIGYGNYVDYELRNGRAGSAAAFTFRGRPTTAP